MKRYLIALAIIAALAVFFGHNAVKTVKASQYKQASASDAGCRGKSSGHRSSGRGHSASRKHFADQLN